MSSLQTGSTQHITEINQLLEKGLLFQINKNYSEAELLYNQALEKDPSNAVAHYRLGCCHLESGQLDQAIRNFFTTLKNDNSYSDAFVGLGLSFEQKNDLVEAREYYLKAIQLNQNHHALAKLAILYQRFGDYLKAENLLKVCLTEQPENFQYLHELASLYEKKHDYTNALIMCEQALEISPYQFSTRILYVELLRKVGAFHKSIDESVFNFDNHINFIPDPSCDSQRFLYKNLINVALCYLSLCNFINLEPIRFEVEQIVRADVDIHQDCIITPSEAISLDLSQDVIEIAIQNFFNKQIIFNMPSKSLFNFNFNFNFFSNKLKIAYLFAGPDYCLLQKYTLDFIKFHDASKFEVFGILLQKPDLKTKVYLDSIFANITDISDTSDEDALTEIKKLNLDILIDLEGYNQFARPQLVINKPAKKIAHWHGCSIPIAHKCYDFFITNSYLQNTSDIPDGSHQISLNSNILFCLPTENPFEVSNQEYNQNQTLETVYFTCFERAELFSSDLFHCWIEILTQVEDSVLLLDENCGEAKPYILDYFQQAGLSPHRVQFNDVQGTVDDWVLNKPTINLDTLSDSNVFIALLAAVSCVPNIVFCGDTPQSQTSACLASSISCDALISHDYDTYIKNAVDLATNIEMYHELTGLLKDVNKSELFKQRSFCEDFEKLFKKMHSSKLSKKDFTIS